MPSLAEPLADAAEQEIRQRHDAFVRWFTGRGDETLIETILASFDAGMAQVTPDGAVLDAEALANALRGAEGGRDEGFAITIEDVRPIWQDATTILIGYVERQTIGGKRTARRSTALMRRADDAPLGIAWLHVHETWMRNA